MDPRSVLGGAVRSTIGLHWDGEGDVADILAVIDADIAQAIQVRRCEPRVDESSDGILSFRAARKKSKLAESGIIRPRERHLRTFAARSTRATRMSRRGAGNFRSSALHLVSRTGVCERRRWTDGHGRRTH
jgi:hypothetical protein